MEYKNIYFELEKLDSDKIILHFKNKNHSFDLEFIEKFKEAIQYIKNLKNIKGVILYGNFPSSIDLKSLNSLNKDASSIFKFIKNIHDIFRSIETAKFPFIAATKKNLVGPGLEIAIACHRIICSANTQFYFPYASKGLMTISGASQRISRIIGVKKSIEMLVNEKKLEAKNALHSRIAHKITSNPLQSSKALLLNNINIIKPWDEKTTKSNFDDIWSTEIKHTFLIENARTHARFKSNYPAPKAILSSLFEGLITNFETGVSIERRWLTWLLCEKNTQSILNYFEKLEIFKNTNVNFCKQFENLKKSDFIENLFQSYAKEGNKLLEEGVSPILIENSALQAGFEKGPLEVSDIIGTNDSGSIGKKINQLGRKGMSNLKGFYNYKKNSEKEIWPELSDLIDLSTVQPEVNKIILRLLKVVAIETKNQVKVNSSIERDLANHIAIQEKVFPMWTGGPMNFLQNQEQQN